MPFANYDFESHVGEVQLRGTRYKENPALLGNIQAEMKKTPAGADAVNYMTAHQIPVYFFEPGQGPYGEQKAGGETDVFDGSFYLNAGKDIPTLASYLVHETSHRKDWDQNLIGPKAIASGETKERFIYHNIQSEERARLAQVDDAYYRANHGLPLPAGGVLANVLSSDDFMGPLGSIYKMSRDLLNALYGRAGDDMARDEIAAALRITGVSLGAVQSPEEMSEIYDHFKGVYDFIHQLQSYVDSRAQGRPVEPAVAGELWLSQYNGFITEFRNQVDDATLARAAETFADQALGAAIATGQLG